MKKWKFFYLFNLIFYIVLPITYFFMNFFEKNIEGIISIVLFKIFAFIPFVLVSVIVIIFILITAKKKGFNERPLFAIIILLIVTILEGVFLATLGAPMLKFLYIHLAITVALIIYQIVMLARKEKTKKL